MRIAVTQMSNEVLLRRLLDAIPAFVFLVDQDVAILDYNAAAAELLGPEPQKALRQRGGEALRCARSKDSPHGCGRGGFCPNCGLRSAVKEAFAGHQVVRRRVRMDLLDAGSSREVCFLVTASPFAYQGHDRVVLVLENLSEVIQLERIIPICVRCHKVRDDKQFWSNVDEYLRRHMDMTFTHSLCPDCVRVEQAKLDQA
jgi:PAS domain-containing protein